MIISPSVSSLVPALAPAQPQPNSNVAVAGSDPGISFSDLVQKLSSEAVTSLQSAESVAISGVQGTLPLQTVVEKIMAAERTLQATLAVRDKAVSAYLEISRMQI